MRSGPLKQSDIGGCSASVTPRMTKIERRAGRFPWRVRCAMTAKFFPRSSVRIANVWRQPRGDNTVRVWDAPIIRNQDAPDDVLLLADLAEAACGSVLQTSGQTEILKLLPPDQVRATREKIAAKFGRQSSGLTPVERLLKWSVSDPRRRTISPFSKVTAPEWIENRIKEGTFESLRAAIQMDSGECPSDRTFWCGARQSCCHRKTDLDNARRAWAEADYQTHRAVKLAPDNSVLLHIFIICVEYLDRLLFSTLVCLAAKQFG